MPNGSSFISFAVWSVRWDSDCNFPNSMHGRWSRFQFGAVIKKFSPCVLVDESTYFYWEYVPKSRIVSQSILLFISSKYCQIVFHNSGANIYSYQQCLNVPVAAHCGQHLVLSGFPVAILAGGGLWCYYLVVLIFISLTTNAVPIFPR